MGTQADGRGAGVALGLDDDGALRLKDDRGQVHRLLAGVVELPE